MNGKNPDKNERKTGKDQETNQNFTKMK